MIPVAIQTDSLCGWWRRLILSLPGAPVDAATRVDWLQGPVFYVDLRQPPALGQPITARCLAELTQDEALLLARQEGFAGRLDLRGNEAEWLRAIDFRPSPLGDRGRLESHGDLLIEHGIESSYVEHWQREPVLARAPSGSALLVTEAGEAPAILVRHGSRFGYARARSIALGRNESLPARIARGNLAEARALVDCEISLGRITPAGWRIERSSLPWRVGTLLLAPGAQIAGGRLAVNDIAGDGTGMVRALRLVELHGSPLPSDEDVDPDPSHEPVGSAGSPGAFTAIPVIDISALGSGHAPAETAVVESLRRAASEVGFLHVTGHGIAPAVIDRLQSAAQRFFALPEAIKRASYIGLSSNHRGYVPEGEEVLGVPDPASPGRDRKEAFDLALDLPAETIATGHPMLGPNQWPDLPGFREDVMAYYAAVFAVGRQLLGGFAMALGQPRDTFDARVTLPPSQLRLIHYPCDAATADSPGIGAHTDYECLTLLLCTGPGLEVMNQAGDWIDAPPVPGALVVNIGDMLEFWSGGAFIATSHRVRPVTAERWSFPLFFALDYDTDLRPLDRPDAAAIRTGEHLYAQTVQTFRYLRDRVAAGTIALPDQARPVASFGQQARHRDGATDRPNLNPPAGKHAGRAA